MIKTAIMQPYIFPYIAYYQLINAVDIFVILDDVNFIMRGWINRNNILLNGKTYLFSIPLNKPSQNKLICETKLNFTHSDREKWLKNIQMAYQKAPYYNKFYPILEEIILYGHDDLTKYLENSLINTLKYLGIEKQILLSSEIEKNSLLKAEDRIIQICKKLDTNLYINSAGGKALYHHENFKRKNMKLNFINTLSNKIIYKQYKNDFIPNLSILDTIMFNSVEDINYFLSQYSLITENI